MTDSPTPKLRPMPSDEEAEKGVLSCVLHDPGRLLPRVRSELGLDAFYHNAHRLLLEVMLDLESAGKPADPIVIGDSLKERDLTQKVGGPSFIMELLDFIPAPTHFDYYRNILKEKMARRAVIAACTELMERAFGLGEEGDWRELCVSAQGELFKLTQEHGRLRDFVPAAALMEEVDTYINEALKNRGHVTHGVATGFTDLDRTLMGLKPGQLFIIAARPSMGKSSIAMNIAECVAFAEGHYNEFRQMPLGVGIVTLEMSGQELLTRMNLGRANVQLGRVANGFFSRSDLKALAEEGMKLRRAPIHILDTGNLTIQELRGLARAAVAQHRLGVLIVDYLQLLKSNTKAARGNRYIEVQDVSQGLKALAKELQIPIIALAQVSRKAEERKGCRPEMGDLRESGDIENDADIIGLLWRESRYKDCPEDQDEEEWASKATLIIAKNRNGPVGDLPLHWTGPLARFRSTTSHLNSNNEEQHQKGE